MTDKILIILCIIIIILLLMVLFKLLSPGKDKNSARLEKSLRDGLSASRREMTAELNGGMQTFSRLLTDNQNQASEAQLRQLKQIQDA